MSTALPADFTSTQFPLELSVLKEGVGGIPSLSPTVAIRDGAILNRYLDWSDMTFKTSAWTQKTRVLTDLGSGYYQASLNFPAIIPAVVSGMTLIAEYYVNNGAGILGADFDFILLLSQNTDLTLLRKLATNRLEEYPGSPGYIVLFDDDGVTPLKNWFLRDAAGGPVLATVGAPARRSAAT